ncbi:hypothetical protein SKAU_G00385050 [Synaphobranchus kaupii]|uniref:Uncharacterized protein n=1 Tax=Synaphobranchus kaupii TaxID=118154 RepID=A0A9Q1EEH5_SYNKA|nr:hypothetical protein SKAU_G00385050 [Synaphobranchus kaupii]
MDWLMGAHEGVPAPPEPTGPLPEKPGDSDPRQGSFSLAEPRSSITHTGWWDSRELVGESSVSCGTTGIKVILCGASGFTPNAVSRTHPRIHRASITAFLYPTSSP